MRNELADSSTFVASLRGHKYTCNINVDLWDTVHKFRRFLPLGRLLLSFSVFAQHFCVFVDLNRSALSQVFGHFPAAELNFERVLSEASIYCVIEFNLLIKKKKKREGGKGCSTHSGPAREAPGCHCLCHWGYATVAWSPVTAGRTHPEGKIWTKYS